MAELQLRNILAPMELENNFTRQCGGGGGREGEGEAHTDR